MKKALFGSGIALAALVLAAGVVPTAQAASVKYNFTAKAIVTDVDLGEKTIKADVKKVVGKGQEMQDNNIEFEIDKAKVYKIVKGKDVRVTYKNFAIGQEIGIKGTAYADDEDTYTLSFARIHDTSFTMIGLLQEFDKDAKTLRLQIVSSEYRPNNYKKGQNVNMVFTDDTKFKVKNTIDITPSDVNADAQRVKVSGTIESGNTWKVKSFWDKYKGSK